MLGKGESNVDVEGGEQEERKIVDVVMDWVEVKKRTAPGEHEDEEKKRKTVQISVKVYGLKEFLMDVSLSDNVSDIVRPIPN